ncbi:hypothetical protein BJ165DRAFT_1610681 [Panaeolus papilionaceus]|nr:hypothetical protein BJ165DRAFT_1610681 [Panaeolus papilionaceus]
MENVPFSRCAIFCVANIPPSTIDRFVEETVQHLYVELHPLYEVGEIEPDEHFMLMTSKDASTLRHGLKTPVQLFESPFIGETIDEVAAWFSQNITGHADRLGYMAEVFIVLDTEAVEQGICTIVEARDGRVQKVRSDFSLAMLSVQNLHANEDMEESSMRPYSRTGVAMTKENLKLVQSGGLYLDGMEVLIDEEWKSFSRM